MAQKIIYPLIPFSWLYGLCVQFRNFLFECGVLKSESYDIPILSVGNITVGGTGKTPMTEYLVRLLSEKHQVSIVSRGYKRKSKGYLFATSSHTMSDIGDEPYQMKHKFPDIHLAVDANRNRAITNLCGSDITPSTDVIIMDDGFQHRYVQPGINIVLMDYHRLPYNDYLLPAGRLREPKSSCRRADIVIVTKCPHDTTPTEERGIERSLNLQPWQKLFYSSYKYGDLKPLSHYIHSEVSGMPSSDDVIPLSDLKSNKYSVLLLTGIASPSQLEGDFKQFCPFQSLRFSDHHQYDEKDISAISTKLKEVDSDSRIAVTTEKDAMRLLEYLRTHSGDETDIIRNRFKNFYVLPVEVSFMKDQEEEFNKIILSYVEKNSRNSTLLKAGSTHTS